MIIKSFTSFINHEHFSDITKDKSCAFVSVGPDVGARMEAVHEALWQGVYIRPMSSDFKGSWNLSVGDGTSIPKGSTVYSSY